MSQPYIRKYNYIADYYNTVYEYGMENYVAAYPITYYQIDWVNSVYDEDLAAASYEKYGLGVKSGMKWKKILMIPIHQIEELTPTHDADEKGLILGESEISSFVIGSDIGIVPTEWDFIHFKQDFMYTNSTEGPIFVVKNVDQSTYGNKTFYKPSIQVTDSSTLDKLDSQLSDQFMFVEFTKKIHPILTAQMLMNLQQKHTNLASKLESKCNPTNLYIQGD